MDYIKKIRKKVGKDKIFLNFTSGILHNSGKILLQIRADRGTWGLPGGAIELGESAAEALMREFYEETGIKVIPVKLQNVYTKYTDSYPNGDEAQVITILYLVNAVSDFVDHNFNNDEIQNLIIVNQRHEDMIKDFYEKDTPVER